MLDASSSSVLSAVPSPSSSTAAAKTLLQAMSSYFSSFSPTVVFFAATGTNSLPPPSSPHDNNKGVPQQQRSLSCSSISRRTASVTATMFRRFRTTSGAISSCIGAATTGNASPSVPPSSPTHSPSPSSFSSSSSPLPPPSSSCSSSFSVSPFVLLSALSAILLLLVPIPNQFFLQPILPNQHQHSSIDEWGKQQPEGSFQFFLPEEEFCCGGGPFSYYAASLISIPCDRQPIHLCCEQHDRCYEQRNVTQSFCDDEFCACLDTIHSSAYCATIAHPGLCLATRVFGHLFHWSANCTQNEEGKMASEECMALMAGIEADWGGQNKSQ